MVCDFYLRFRERAAYCSTLENGDYVTVVFRDVWVNGIGLWFIGRSWRFLLAWFGAVC